MQSCFSCDVTYPIELLVLITRTFLHKTSIFSKKLLLQTHIYIWRGMLGLGYVGNLQSPWRTPHWSPSPLKKMILTRNERVGVCHDSVGIIFFSGKWGSLRGSSRRLQVPYVIPRPDVTCHIYTRKLRKEFYWQKDSLICFALLNLWDNLSILFKLKRQF